MKEKTEVRTCRLQNLPSRFLYQAGCLALSLVTVAGSLLPVSLLAKEESTKSEGENTLEAPLVNESSDLPEQQLMQEKMDSKQVLSAVDTNADVVLPGDDEETYISWPETDMLYTWSFTENGLIRVDPSGNMEVVVKNSGLKNIYSPDDFKMETCENRISVLYLPSNLDGPTDYVSVIYYDMSQDKEEKRFVLQNLEEVPDDYLIDETGRLFLLYSGEDQSRICLYDMNGSLLDEVAVQGEIIQLDYYDSVGEILFFDTAGIWTNNGYDYHMNYLGAVQLSKNQFGNYKTQLENSSGESLMLTRNYSYSMGINYCSVVNDTMLVDSPANDALLLFSMSDFRSSFQLPDQMHSMDRYDDEDDLTKTDARVISVSDKNKAIVYQSPGVAAQINLTDGAIQATYQLNYPIRSILNGKNGPIFVYVKDEKLYRHDGTICQDGLMVTPTSLTLEMSETKQLDIASDQGWGKNVIWNSSNPKVATVSADGLVFAVSPGSCILEAKNPGSETVQVAVEVIGDGQLISKREKKTLAGSAFESYYSETPLFNYSNYGSTIPYAIVELSDGFLRVDGENGKLIIDKYSTNGAFQESRSVSTALPIYGGFLASEDAYYVVSGQENPSDSDDVAVLAIEKYSLEWVKQAQTVLHGENTYEPFEAGSCRLTKAKDRIIVHTCHTMYKSDDGLHHQANMTFVFDASDLTKTDSYSGIMNIADAGYVSHSFNQFVKADDTYLYRVDHGDAYPRGVSIVKSVLGQSITDVEYTVPFWINGNSGNNYTGVSLGGFELSDSTCLIAGKSIDQESLAEPGNIFVTITSKDLIDSKTVWLTSRNDAENWECSSPKLVKIAPTAYLVLWQERENDTVSTHIAAIDSEGRKIADDVKTSLPLSECEPVLFSDQSVRWLARRDDKPVLCSVALYGEDVPEKANPVSMYRLYNPNSGEHFYTARAAEKDHLVSVGWKYEGTGWLAPEESTIPVYRVYNPNAGDHHYTMNKAEKDHLVSIGWKDEGIGWYSDEEQEVPLYRQYNPNAKAGSHNYTTNAGERDYLVSIGWKDEGIGWYGMKE